MDLLEPRVKVRSPGGVQHGVCGLIPVQCLRSLAPERGRVLQRLLVGRFVSSKAVQSEGESEGESEGDSFKVIGGGE